MNADGAITASYAKKSAGVTPEADLKAEDTFCAP